MFKKKIKLLVLDDERDICEFVKGLFRKKGFSVSSALSGNEAIRKIKKLNLQAAVVEEYPTHDALEIDVMFVEDE